ncbi:MAG TPA: hypothetical protein VK158_04315 [Acidobacteriota bacterium]|nr:hypothetical protein [Acidobacteriota bacterium]
MLEDYFGKNMAHEGSTVSRWISEKEAEIKRTKQEIPAYNQLCRLCADSDTRRSGLGMFRLETPPEKLKRLENEMEELDGWLDGLRAVGSPLNGGQFTVTGTPTYLSGYKSGVQKRNHLVSTYSLQQQRNLLSDL